MSTSEFPHFSHRREKKKSCGSVGVCIKPEQADNGESPVDQVMRFFYEVQKKNIRY